MRRLCLAVAMLAGVATASAQAGQAIDLARYVDPFIGTDGTGHVFPGATRPFGMVAPSPDNAGGGWDFTSGYQYRAPKILGFSNTHISGAGIPDLGDVLLQPVAGTPWSAATTDFSSAYRKKTESARPGHYAVTLYDHGVKVELTAAQRVAFHRYTFARGGSVQVLVDLQHGLHYGESPRVIDAAVDTDAVAGEISGTVRVKGWTEREASFVLRFSEAFSRAETLPARAGEKAPRLLLTFAAPRNRLLEVRIALSTVDVAGARGNLAAEGGRRFDAVRADARAEWNRLLNRIVIDAPDKQKRVFYSALYRALMHPSDIADVDGRVRGPAGQVMAARGGSYYSTLSLWDTFRAAQPLLTLVAPERVDGIINTLLDHHKTQGYLPLWTSWGRETHTMIGNPALPVIADAVAKGFQGFDRNEALAAMVTTSTAARPRAPEWAQRDWSAYEEFGYVPLDRVGNEAVSLTLEYGIGDDAVARVAGALGQGEVAKRFSQRAQGYRRLFDAETKMMRGRDSKGAWRTPFDPLAATSPLNNPGDYTEANAWQYTLTPALHDPEGLTALLGGPKGLGDWLDRFFSTPMPKADKHLGQEAMIGQYAHGNEPSHHIAYLYAWSDRPWKTGELVKRITRDFYADRPNGIIGNDDCGQMSAWYVLSTLGFYPVVPASGTYVLGMPQVRRAQLQLATGKQLAIVADLPRAPNRGIRATLNGSVVPPMALPHADLLKGGLLRFE